MCSQKLILVINSLLSILKEAYTQGRVCFTLLGDPGHELENMSDMMFCCPHEVMDSVDVAENQRDNYGNEQENRSKKLENL